jgi:hypothetical protein
MEALKSACFISKSFFSPKLIVSKSILSFGLEIGLLAKSTFILASAFKRFLS